MAIPGPGVAISMNTLNTEFGGGYSLSSYYRGGSFVPNIPQNAAVPTSGQISLGNFYNTQKRISVSITATGNNYDVYANRGGSYSPGITDLTVTVPGTIGSSSTGAYAMLVPNAFSPTDTVTIINNGVIQGAGGAGGRGGSPSFPAPGNTPKPGSPGATGGNALYVNRPVVITNNGTIAGGGGGGGGGGGRQTAPTPGKPAPTPGIAYIGGGGGGGAGTVGGGGGLPNGGTGGTLNGGGGGAKTPAPTTFNATGGAGGGRGAVGAAAPSAPTGGTPGAGGSAGYYLVGNAFVTWPATGTRQGNLA